MQEYVREVVVVLGRAAGASGDALRQEVALQASEADADGNERAVCELAGELLPGEVLSDISGAAEVYCRKSRASARAYHLMLWVVGEIAEELELHGRTGHGAAPAPPLLVVGVELHPFERPLDPTEIRVGVHVGDEEHVDVCRAEVNRNDPVIAREDLWHEASEHNEEHLLLTELVQETDERKLSACSRRTGALLIHGCLDPSARWRPRGVGR